MQIAFPLLRVGIASAAWLLLTGCEGLQSTLAPQGPAARSIANISWVMFIGAAVVLALVMALALVAVLRAPAKRRGISDGMLIAVGGFAWPVLTLSALLVYGVYQMGDLRADDPEDMLRIEVIGNQWWWEVRYPGRDGAPDAVTANEIHIPAGVPVAVALRSRDVIHSFWVPNLAGKMDLIPGRTNHLRLQADAPGRFRGQCAEFCGAQHARMAFLVVAEPPERFAAWLAAQRRPAAPPAGEAAQRGYAAFAQHCSACHSVRGLLEGTGVDIGPDLTHLGSRAFIGAGTLENTPGSLRRFVADNQRVKPGNRMPDFGHLDEATLTALVAYLEELR